ncbi:MAG: carbohydrate-binding protein [Gammaproteobacteria bacterium]
MFKRIIGFEDDADSGDRALLALEELADIELTSEDPEFPIESALSGREGPGWRAGRPGRQIIRLIFKNPQDIHCVWLRFEESDRERTQEYCLRWSKDRKTAPTEILRQHWNFSPPGTSAETEKHVLDLADVKVLELMINPDIGSNEAFATLNRLKIA